MITITIKQGGLYAAYAPEFKMAAWGACHDEALNNLTDELRQHGAGEATGDKENSHAVR